MNSINSEMPFIRVNDIFDELLAENQRLLKEIKFSKKLINVLNKYLNEFNFNYKSIEKSFDFKTIGKI